MAKKLIKRTTKSVSKNDLAKKLKNQLSSGAGRRAIIPSKNIEEEIKKNPEKVVKEYAQNFAMIPIKEIEANPDQPRKEFEEEALKELSNSIKVHGIIQPMTVRRMAEGQYQIISGERRWRASQLAGLTEVPAYIRFADDQSLMEMALIENIQREDLNPIEVGISYYRLKEEFDLTDKELATRLGKQRTTITHYRNLLTLHIEAIEALKSGLIGMGHGRALTGVKDQLLQKDILDKILDKNLSVRKTEELVASYKSNLKKKTKPKLSMDHQRILDDFKAFFGTQRVTMDIVDKETGKGKIVLPFNNNDELTEFFKMIEQL